MQVLQLQDGLPPLDGVGEGASKATECIDETETSR